MNRTTRPSAGILTLTVLAAAVLAGCSVTPPPTLSSNDLVTQAVADRTVMFGAQEPVNGPITLDEAIARAVKYNLQQRLALMERAVEDNMVEVQSQGMLPKLAASAGLRTRNNDYASSSESVITHTQSLEPSTSQERTGATADLRMTWNVLDFGLSYFSAKAQGNKALAAEERRRRVVADIIRQTRTAYWEAVTAERLKNDVTRTLAMGRDALAKAKETEKQRLLAPIVALRYQRDLLGMLRQTETLDNDLHLAKARLAALMNLPPNTEYTLAAPDAASLQVPTLAYSLDDLESVSMVRRPEIREESYNARNAVLETRMSLLRLLPNASLFGALNIDSNKYLVNERWADAGVQVSWNLMNLLSVPSITRTAKTREQLAEMRRQALRMTVLTQVHVAWLERQRAEATYKRASELSRLQDAIQQQTVNAARSNAETQLELVRTSVETLLATRARDLSYAELVNAQNTVYQAAGIDPLPDTVADTSVDGLAKTIAMTNRIIEAGHLDIPQLSMALPPALPVASTQDGAVTVNAVPTPTTQTLAAAPAPAPTPALRELIGTHWHRLGAVSSQTDEDSDAQ